MGKYQIQSRGDRLIGPDVLSSELQQITSQGNPIDSLSITINHASWGYEDISYGAKHHEILVPWLKSNALPIKKISLYGNCISDQQIIEIIDAICNNPKFELEELDINHNDFGTPALEYIVQKLKDKQIRFRVVGFMGYDNGRYGNDKLLTPEAEALIQEIERHNQMLASLQKAANPLILNEKKCNAALLLYTDGHVILQKNQKFGVPQWASAGGKVDESDRQAISDPQNLDELNAKLVKFLQDAFKAEKGAPSTKAIFAYAALREAIEELASHNTAFIIESVISGQATLVSVNRDSYGIPEADPKFWTEIFYLDFGNMPAATLIAKLQASGKEDCIEITAAPIHAFEQKTSADSKTNTFYQDIMVRHTVAVISQHISSLRVRIQEIKALTTPELMQMPLPEDDLLRRTDLGAGFHCLYLPKGSEDTLENLRVILGKRFNGTLKGNTGGAVDCQDETFFKAANRENKEEQFAALPIGNNPRVLDSNVVFKANSGSSKKEGYLYSSFLLLIEDYTQQELNDAVVKMNTIAPPYFKLSAFFVELSKRERTTDAQIQEEAEKYLAIAKTLPPEFAFNPQTIAQLDALAAGNCTLQGQDFIQFAKDNIHIYAEYNWFIQIPYLAYKAALQNKTSLPCSITEIGVDEEVPLFKPESNTALQFLIKFEANRTATKAKESGQSSTPAFVAISTVGSPSTVVTSAEERKKVVAISSLN